MSETQCQTLQKFAVDIQSGVPISFTVHSRPEMVGALNDAFRTRTHGTVEAVREMRGSWLGGLPYQAKTIGEPWLGPSVDETLAKLVHQDHGRCRGRRRRSGHL